MNKRLFKSTRNIMVSGVCGGLAEFFSIDPSLVRFLWVLLSLASFGFGLLAYVACAIILPKDIDIH